MLVAPSTSHDPAQRLVRAALQGLRRTELRVIAVTNRRPLPRAAPATGRARLVDWLSYERTMPQCSLVVCLGGFGTLARALSSGVPVLVVPHSGDMGENAARADWAGVGVRLPWRLLSPLTLRLAVARALDPAEGLAARAAEIAAWARCQRRRHARRRARRGAGIESIDATCARELRGWDSNPQPNG